MIINNTKVFMKICYMYKLVYYQSMLIKQITEKKNVSKNHKKAEISDYFQRDSVLLL